MLQHVYNCVLKWQIILPLTLILPTTLPSFPSSTKDKDQPWVSLGRCGSTDASVGLVSITAGITVERPSFQCDYVQREKTHRPGISSLLLTLELCSVALSFALPYLLPPTRDVCITAHHRCITVHHRGPRLPWGQSLTAHDQCSPHPGPN